MKRHQITASKSTIYHESLQDKVKTYMIESSELEVLFKVRVCFNFDATSEDELSIREGDIIHVTQVFEGWSTGR